MKKFILFSLTAPIIFSINISGTAVAADLGENNILFYADTQTNDSRHKKLVDVMIKYNPMAIFHGGDLVDEPTPTQWVAFKDIAAPLLNIAPFYPAPGNHERDQKAYYDNFELPNNKKWYSVDVENAHFIALNTGIEYGVRLDKDSEQFKWLAQDLEEANNNPNTKFIITYFHHPLYTTCPWHKANEYNLRKDLIPLFKQYNVDVVFNGHLHCYERTFVDGIYHIVSSGGGGDIKPGLPQINSDTKYSQKRQQVYHFSKINVDASKLTVTAIDINNKIIDSFSIPTKH